MKASLAAPLLVLSLIGCMKASDDGSAFPAIELTSSSLASGIIPKKSTCNGSEVSPALSWKAPPANTKSFALIVTDLDSLFAFAIGPVVHWVAYGIDAARRDLPEGIPAQAQLPDGLMQGKNRFDKTGYMGPCPRGWTPHRYAFDLYALDTSLSLPAGATGAQVTEAMKGHILAKGRVVGRYQN